MLHSVLLSFGELLCNNFECTLTKGRGKNVINIYTLHYIRTSRERIYHKLLLVLTLNAVCLLRYTQQKGKNTSSTLNTSWHRCQNIHQRKLANTSPFVQLIVTRYKLAWKRGRWLPESIAAVLALWSYGETEKPSFPTPWGLSFGRLQNGTPPQNCTKNENNKTKETMHYPRSTSPLGLLTLWWTMFVLRTRLWRCSMRGLCWCI